MRLDHWLFTNKFFESRNKAQNAILNKHVYVNSMVCTKPSYIVKSNDLINLDESEQYVSRGAYKLLHAIDIWKLDITNKVILDIGASTGGFSEVCLNKGAKFVYALDCAHNQLHCSLKSKPNIKQLVMNFKNMNISHFNHHIDLIVGDVSFISLTKLIDTIIHVFNYSYECVFLIKPQFELSKGEIKKGVVNKKTLHDKVINKIINYCLTNHFKVIDVIASPIKGNKKQNKEFLIYLKKDN